MAGLTVRGCLATMLAVPASEGLLGGYWHSLGVPVRVVLGQGQCRRNDVSGSVGKIKNDGTCDGLNKG